MATTSTPDFVQWTEEKLGGGMVGRLVGFDEKAQASVRVVADKSKATVWWTNRLDAPKLQGWYNMKLTWDRIRRLFYLVPRDYSVFDPDDKRENVYARVALDVLEEIKRIETTHPNGMMDHAKWAIYHPEALEPGYSLMNTAKGFQQGDAERMTPEQREQAYVAWIRELAIWTVIQETIVSPQQHYDRYC